MIPGVIDDPDHPLFGVPDAARHAARYALTDWSVPDADVEPMADAVLMHAVPCLRASAQTETYYLHMVREVKLRVRRMIVGMAVFAVGFILTNVLLLLHNFNGWPR